MDKPSYKLVGGPCGQQGQYTFYKGLRVTAGKQDQVLAIGDFFFVRIWQDSELVSIGELQLLWTDRVSDQTLVSLRLYFLPENTPDGRNQHGEDEVLSLNEKVVLRAEDLLSWICDGSGFRCGLRAVYRGGTPSNPPTHEPLHQTSIDFSDVMKEKSAIEQSPESRGVVVFSYPRYCRYRALLARSEGLQASWLRDAVLAALGGFAANTANTTVLYCKDTFEYPELEGHEFVCNHLLPRLKGRSRGRRRRRSRSRSRSSDSEPAPTEEVKVTPSSPRRLSLRGAEPEGASKVGGAADRHFLRALKHFYSTHGNTHNLTLMHGLKDLSLYGLYEAVKTLGGYDAVCRNRLWRQVHSHRPTKARGLYARYLRPFELHEASNGRARIVTDKPPATSPPSTVDNVPSVVSVEDKSESQSHTAEELNRQFLEETKPLIAVKPPQLLIDPDKHKKVVMKLFTESGGLGSELAGKYKTTDSAVLEEVGTGKLSESSCSLVNELAQRLKLGEAEMSSVKQICETSSPALPNGHADTPDQRPAKSSSLRSVRVKPARPRPSPPATAASAPPVTNFGIHRPRAHSDDEIIEVPYKPKTPEIIDLDEYPESPQSSKKKKLDILKARGLEVTPLPFPPPLQLAQASLLHAYNILPLGIANGVQPPRVIQSSCVFGSTCAEKTVYNNPKEPLMPAPLVLRPAPTPRRPLPRPAALDLTCKPTHNYTLIDGKAVVGSNLEITLVSPKNSPKRTPQKRSSNGKFMSSKTPTPPKETKDSRYPSPQKTALTIPSYQISKEEVSPSSSSSSNSFKNLDLKGQNLTQNLGTMSNLTQNLGSITNLTQMMDINKSTPISPFVDPMYMSALYSSLAGQMDQRQLAMYRELMANQLRYSSLLGGVATPTTKN